MVVKKSIDKIKKKVYDRFDVSDSKANEIYKELDSTIILDRDIDGAIDKILKLPINEKRFAMALLVGAYIDSRLRNLGVVLNGK